MFGNQFRQKAIETFERAMDRKNHTKRLGHGVARDVYDMGLGYVIKIENIYHVDENYLTREGRRVKEVLNKYINGKEHTVAGFKFNFIKSTKEVLTYKKFCKTLDYEESKETVLDYMDFLYGSSCLQNVHDFVNYAEIKDNRHLNKYAQKCLGIFKHEGYTILIQEKGENDESYGKDKAKTKKVNEVIRKMATDFTEQGLGLRDYSPDNVVIDTKGNVKICDLGICEFGSYPYMYAAPTSL